MAIEALDLGEEPHVERVAIEDADGVVRIDRRDQAVAGVVDRLQVPRRDEAGDAGDREVASASPALMQGSPRRARSTAGQLRRRDLQRIALLRWCGGRRPPSRAQRRVARSGAQLVDPFLAASTARNPLTPSAMISRLTPTARRHDRHAARHELDRLESALAARPVIVGQRVDADVAGLEQPTSSAIDHGASSTRTPGRTGALARTRT